jgi:NADPH-dependent 2,4-dienoyl-CoA reductase/sulfur reductase-like enzyme
VVGRVVAQVGESLTNCHTGRCLVTQYIYEEVYLSKLWPFRDLAPVIFSFEMGSHQKRVAVIGAGLSGIVSAKHLKESGIEVVVFERSRQAGGNWLVW